MDDLDKSYKDKDNFPINLTSPGIYRHRLEEYHQELEKDAPRLFSSESEAALDFLEYNEAGKGNDWQTSTLAIISLIS